MNERSAVARKKRDETEKRLARYIGIRYCLCWVCRSRHMIAAALVLLLLWLPALNAQPGVYPEEGLVSGRVMNVGNSQGIAGVIIEAFRVEDSGLIVYSGQSVSASDGSYSLQLPGGVYFLRAKCDRCLIGEGQTVVYYHNQFDPLRAEVVNVVSGEPSADIDFELNLSVPDDNYISGRVTDESTGEGLPDVVVTAMDCSSGAAVNSALSGHNGDFRVGNLPCGDYLLFFSGYHIIPYFFRATEFWQRAEIIHLETDYSGIQSDAITQDYGNLLLMITGRVKCRSRAIGGARVYAYLLGEDRPRAFAASNEAGEYAITNGLVPGYYRVVCDLFGYDSQEYPGTVYLDLLENPAAENIGFSIAPVTTDIEGEPEKPEMISIFQNYPNPFNAGTTIPVYSAYSGKTDAEISIYDILGRRVGGKRAALNPGMNHISWGLDDFSMNVSSGVFFYVLNGREESHTMILLK